MTDARSTRSGAPAVEALVARPPLMRLGLLAGLGLAGLSLASPATAQMTTRSLVEVADFSGLAVSPDQQKLALRVHSASVDQNGYSSAWYVQSVSRVSPPIRISDGGAPLRSDGGTALAETPRWSADSNWLYYRAMLENGVQVVRAAADGATAKAVTSDEADVEAFGFLSNRQLIYVVGAARDEIAKAEEREYETGIRIDSTVPVGSNLYRSGFINGRLATQRYTGRWMARQSLLGGAPKTYRVVDLQSGSVRDATEEERLRYETASRAPDAIPAGAISASRSLPGDYALAYATSASGKTQMRARARQGGEIRCEAETCTSASLSWIGWAGTDDAIIFAVNDRDRGGAQTLFRWDIAGNRVSRLAQSDGYLNGGSPIDHHQPCSLSTRYAFCVHAAANVPPRLERIDLVSGDRVVLFQPNVALQSAKVKAELLRWQDDSGRSYTGQFYPAISGSGARPPLFIIYYDCGGFIRGGTGDEWPLATFAEHGIAALCVNQASGGGSGAPAVNDYEAGLDSIESVLPVLRARGVDTTRVGMGGLSFGAEVLMWVAMHANILSAGSIASGMMTPTYFWFHDLQGEDFRKRLMRSWGLGAPEETPDQWRRLSPVFNRDAIRLPLLFQLPEQEYLPSIEFFAPLQRQAVPVEMWVFPNEPHVKVQPRHKQQAYDRNVDWFRFWLQGYVDPDPQKAIQFQRWETLRTNASQGLAGESGPRPQ